jgi:hypothetical protein
MNRVERFLELQSKVTTSGLTPKEKEELTRLAPTVTQADVAALQELQQQKQEAARQFRIVQILQRVRYNGKVLKDCAANEEFISELPPNLSPDEITQAFAANPKLASSFLWVDLPASKTDPKQLAKDLETLRVAAKANGNFGASEANLALCREVLGAGFSEYTLNQAIRANALRLSAPTQEERDQWAAEAHDQEQLRLRNLDTRCLKDEVREGFDQRRAASAQANADRVLKAKQEEENQMGYPPLPAIYQGKPVNQKFFKECSRETMRYFLQRYGDFQCTQAIRGIR